MRKSASIVLGLVQAVSAAALAGGCGSRVNSEKTWQTCVDRSNTAVDERNCEDEQRTDSLPGYRPYYRYYYYRSNFAPVIGYPVREGGAYVRPPGAIAHPSSVTRGGFGSTASGHVSGGES